MALILAILAASISAEPAKLVLGKDSSATLSVEAPSSATVTLSTSVGSVSEAKREGNVFRAQFTPPKVRSPAVALVLAQIDDGGSRELAWLAIPLWGSDTMVIETRPGSKVEANVAGIHEGPVVADEKGTVRLPMTVPPGVRTATLHITDKLGNSTDKPLDLDPPPFSRVRAAAREASAAPGEPLELEIFAVHPDGTPDDNARLDAAGGLGDISVEKRIGHGLYLAKFMLPGTASGTQRVSAKLNGQTFTVDVPVKAGTERVQWWKSALGPQRPWTTSVGAFAGGGAMYRGPAAGTLMLEGAMRLARLPLEALLDAGFGFFEGAVQGTESAKPTTLYLQAGLRFGRQLVPGLDGHLTAFAGAQHQSVTITPPAGAATSGDGWTPRYGVAFGVNLRLGPGRAFAQIQLDGAGSGAGGLTESTGGVQLLAGYLVTVY